jgi:hypothetical protein
LLYRDARRGSEVHCARLGHDITVTQRCGSGSVCDDAVGRSLGEATAWRGRG